jgi:hypothetical protein
MEWLFVLIGIVAVWQLGGLIRDLWYMLRDRKEDLD